MSNPTTAPSVDEAKREVIGLWMRRASLEQQLELEACLQAEIKNADFTCEVHDVETIFSTQLAQKVDHSPLIDYYLKLCKEEQEMRDRLTRLNNGAPAVETIASISQDVDRLKKENAALQKEADNLALQIATFDDPETHGLLAEMQHLQLQRIKGNVK